MSTFLRQLARVTAAGLLLPILGAQAQTWPAKPIRLIVPFEAGGPTDLLARGVATRIGEGLNTTVLPENRTGAGTLIAAELTAKAPPTATPSCSPPPLP